MEISGTNAIQHLGKYQEPHKRNVGLHGMLANKTNVNEEAMEAFLGNCTRHPEYKLKYFCDKPTCLLKGTLFCEQCMCIEKLHDHAPSKTLHQIAKIEDFWINDD